MQLTTNTGTKMAYENVKLLENVRLDSYDKRNDSKLGFQHGVGKKNPTGHSGSPKPVDFAKQLPAEQKY